MKKFIIGVLFALALSGNANAHLTPDEQAAKSRGILLFNQYKNAQLELRIAAEAGDAEAQFYLAERLRKEKQFMTAEAQKWYEESANQNNVYAMIQLGRSGDNLCVNMGNCPESTKTPAQWLKGALDLTKPVAESGDPEAMYLMYELTLKEEWLEKSANSGYALAQYWMAIGTRQGDGFFLPWKRHEAIGNWLKLSAEGGYPPAMMEYAAFIYEDQGDLTVARHWIVEAAKKGYKSGVSSYGAYSAHSPSLFDFPLDRVKGYALTSLLSELDGGGDVQVYVNETLPEIAEKMTPEQISEANEFAKNWKATHPPLSFFPEKLSR